MKTAIAFLLALTATPSFVHAQSVCGNNDFCTVWQVKTSVGECSAGVSVCDDGDDTTESSCEPNSFRCSHVALEPDSICFSDCVPNCKDKECGEDECGGFCGQCVDGLGCSNYACVGGSVSGTCAKPLNLGNGTMVTVIDTMERTTLTAVGDTSQSIHFETPTCNTLSSSPEVVFTFEVASGRNYGYDIRTTGYDTVVQLMRGTCNNKRVVSCNDDGTPPGDLGSRISGEIEEGTYFVMVDGYSTTDSGPFELVATFVHDCFPLCDGNFCGSDGCGRYIAADSQRDNNGPAITDRECGEDGCGGSCGTCGDGLFCLGESIAPDEETETIPGSSCSVFEICDHMNPVCEGCGDSQICASDCQCYDSLDNLGDLVIVVEHMLEGTYLQDVDFQESSCSLVEGCVMEPGVRRLLRYTSSILNQGKADISFPEPKDRPDLFEYGACHQHYHFKKISEYTLFKSDGKTVALSGQKNSYCIGDTLRQFDGVNVGCSKKYDCDFQGIQKGWLDSYGWNLDCSWIDVTDLDAGDYVLEIRANPGQVFPEISFDNNAARIRVNIPQLSAVVSEPLKLGTRRFNENVQREPENQVGSTAFACVGGIALIIFNFASVLF